MDEKKREDTEMLVSRAVEGDQEALEQLLTEVQDLVFNLSLRMLGTIQDAEDASQEILIRVMTNLASFRGESAFSTWVFRIAVNHLKNYRKSMFARQPLSFEYYGEDIVSGKEKDIPDLTMGVDRNLLEQELKLSCTNVMLQCLYWEPCFGWTAVWRPKSWIFLRRPTGRGCPESGKRWQDFLKNTAV